MKIVLATHNRGKISELQALIVPIDGVPISQFTSTPPEETGSSFIENAILKARYASRIAQLPALADDSGLIVDALHGLPGIRSARFAGDNASDDANIACLLEALRDVPESARTARFYCALAFVQHVDDPMPLMATGECIGQITFSRNGDNGFGYDPVFYVPEYGCTFAVLAPEIKNTISHRARALQGAAQWFRR